MLNKVRRTFGMSLLEEEEEEEEELLTDVVTLSSFLLDTYLVPLFFVGDMDYNLVRLLCLVVLFCPPFVLFCGSFWANGYLKQDRSVGRYPTSKKQTTTLKVGHQNPLLYEPLVNPIIISNGRSSLCSSWICSLGESHFVHKFSVCVFSHNYEKSYPIHHQLFCVFFLHLSYYNTKGPFVESSNKSCNICCGCRKGS
jgi:hypothetical protein